jgi:hypothetical protein
MAIERDIEIPQGSQVRVKFQLNVRGVGTWNVAGASDIRMTLSDESGAPLAAVEADDADPAAAWATGLVPVLIPSTVLATVRTLSYALVVSIGDEIVIPIRGKLYVEQTAGY